MIFPLEEAEQIVLGAYAEAWGSDAVPADELELYPGFYRLGHSEPVYWSFYICEKDTYNVLWHVELDGKTGRAQGVTPWTPAPPGGGGWQRPFPRAMLSFFSSSATVPFFRSVSRWRAFRPPAATSPVAFRPPAATSPVAFRHRASFIACSPSRAPARRRRAVRRSGG